MALGRGGREGRRREVPSTSNGKGKPTPLFCMGLYVAAKVWVSNRKDPYKIDRHSTTYLKQLRFKALFLACRL